MNASTANTTTWGPADECAEFIACLGAQLAGNRRTDPLDWATARLNIWHTLALGHMAEGRYSDVLAIRDEAFGHPASQLH